MKLILASSSPRRKDFFIKAGYDFEIITGDFKEDSISENPYKTAVFFAKGKAESVFNALQNKDEVIVVGVDTLVYHNGKILGKPVCCEHAKEMLTSLSGKTHEVISGYAVLTAKQKFTGYVKTDVTFNDLTDIVIENYLNSGLYKGKAGSYGIQDGYNLVKEYSGSYNNVIGLPTETVFPIIDKLL
jgi:septum formation protein